MKFTVYSEDFQDVGMHSISVTASLTNYPEITSEQTTIQFEVRDSCPNPFSVVAPEQSDPADYYYTGSSPMLSFSLVPFEVDPSVCAVTYSCRVASGERTDLCVIQDGTTTATFNTETGAYTFSSTDI